MGEQAGRGVSLAEAADSVTIDAIGTHVATAAGPAPDLIIRTSGEQRISGFLSWVSPYAEIYFCDTNWPGFRKLELLRILRSFGQRRTHTQ